jgi:murein L,D-transpeptidase YcbB/YkuD
VSRHRHIIRRTGLALVATLLTACWGTQPSAAAIVAPGFFEGFWHGLISPIAFLVSLFVDHVRIYAFPNAGLWYDFGFMLGIGGFSGGLFAGSRSSSGSAAARPETREPVTGTTTEARSKPMGINAKTVLFAVSVAGTVGAPSAEALPPQDAAVARAIARRLDELSVSESITIGVENVPRSRVLLELYERRAFQPLWSDEERALELLTIIRDAQLDGLDPDDYHRSTLEDAREGLSSPGRTADLDVLRTDALIRITHDLRFGKLEAPGPEPRIDLSRPLLTTDAPADLEAILSARRLRQAVQSLRPMHFVYVGLVRALSELRRIEASGGWPAIPLGPAMRRDSVDARVPALRQRLALERDLPLSAAGSSLVFDETLETAVRTYQHRHGLNEDGVVGRSTLRELNVEVGPRIDQVRVNLERARWVTRELPDSFVVVNIAGAKVYVVRDGSVVFETRAVVGRGYTRTPVFRSTIQHVELNPTWTVPASIVDEVLAEARADTAYLAKQGFRLLSPSGNQITERIDLGRYSAPAFPWTLRQDPGPLNPLGRLKFVFPNPYSVYLHDTPRRDLFAREERLFSHGCIRVQDPLGLAELLLDDRTRWSRSALEAAIANGTTLTLPLPRPVAVVVQYWTASADEAGTLHFYRDVYGRDASLLAALGPEGGM